MLTKQEEGREKWIHEDNLLNHRLTWLGLTQTLLFAALGLVIQQSGTSGPQPTSAQLTMPGSALTHSSNLQNPILLKLVNGLPIVGLVTSMLILIGTLAATAAMARIKRQFDLPRYGISLSTTVAGWICAVGLPYAFTVTWALIINTTWGSIFSVVIGIAIVSVWIVLVRDRIAYHLTRIHSLLQARTNTSSISALRLYLLRAMYLLIAIGLAITTWPGIISPSDSIANANTVIRALLGALAVMAALGIRYPLKMLPILLFEFLWKAIWVVAFASRMLLHGGLDAYASETLFACMIGIVLVPIVVPWRYMAEHYLKASSDPWR